MPNQRENLLPRHPDLYETPPTTKQKTIKTHLRTALKHPSSAPETPPQTPANHLHHHHQHKHRACARNQTHGTAPSSIPQHGTRLKSGNVCTFTPGIWNILLPLSSNAGGATHPPPTSQSTRCRRYSSEATLLVEYGPKRSKYPFIQLILDAQLLWRHVQCQRPEYIHQLTLMPAEKQSAVFLTPLCQSRSSKLRPRIKTSPPQTRSQADQAV